MAAHLTYASNQVVSNFGGLPIDGYAEDSFCTITYNSDFTTPTIGADSDVALAISPDSTGSVTFELIDTSAGAKRLAGLYAGQKSAGKVIRLPLIISDPTGATLVLNNNAHLQSIGEGTLGSGNNTRSFTFFVEEMIFTAVPKGVGEATAAIVTEVNDFVTANLPA